MYNNKSLISLLNLQNLKEKNNIIENKNEPMTRSQTLMNLNSSYINEINNECDFNQIIRTDKLIRSITI